jgi:hypothetical protein
LGGPVVSSEVETYRATVLDFARTERRGLDRLVDLIGRVSPDPSYQPVQPAMFVRDAAILDADELFLEAARDLAASAVADHEIAVL